MSHAGKTSAGFLICSGGLYLVGHSTLKKNDQKIRQFDGNWTIMKGEVDEGETLLQAALRELKEEASIDLATEFPTLMPPEDASVFNTYKTATAKTVQVFLLDDTEGLIQQSGKEFVCTSMLTDMPDKFKHREGAPEVDKFMWVTKEDARRMVFKSQRHLFPETVEL